MGNFFSSALNTMFGDGGESDKQAQLDALDEARKQYAGVTSSRFTPVEYTGLEGPQAQADVSQVGPSSYNDISLDPRLKDTQMEQLAVLADLRANGGMNASDRANLAQIQNQENMNTRSQREAILQNANMRGMSSNGNSMVAQMMAEQGAANRQAQKDLDIAGQAQDRSLQAGNMAATQASGMNKQDFDQQAATAAAKDAAAKFNAEALNIGSRYNAGLRQQTGLANAQANNNQQTMNNYTMPNTKFSNDMSKAKGLAGQSENQAAYYGNNAAQEAKTQGNMWSGAMEMGGGMLGGYTGAPTDASGSYAAGAAMKNSGSGGNSLGLTDMTDQDYQLEAIANARKKASVA